MLYSPVPTCMEDQLHTQLIAALIALGMTIIGSLGLIVRALTERIQTDLRTNTAITRRVNAQMEEEVSCLKADLQLERSRCKALRETLRDREDQLAYIESHHPEIASNRNAWKDRRRSDDSN
jgi:hypothetical protein